MVGNPAATVIISSPGYNFLSFNKGDVNAEIANKFADDPEFVDRENFEPVIFDNCFSNSELKYISSMFSELNILNISLDLYFKINKKVPIEFGEILISPEILCLLIEN